jgi:intracellular sulfur oxidation DsrE/DsrF family protein
MKKLFITLSLAALALASCQAPAPTEVVVEETVENNYFILNRNVEQLKAVGKAAADLAVADSTTYGTFKVVVCGKSVQDLLDEEKMADAVAILQASGVEMYACGLSLKKFGVDPTSLPEFYQVVPNGLVFGFELQKEGYYSITL